MRERTSLFALNKGLISKLGLGRADIKRLALGAETMTNWIPRVLGPMTIRPGMKYLGTTYSSAAVRMLPHVFATDDVSLVEISNSILRIWIEDELLTRPSVSTAVTNGTFASDVASWTDSDEAGATSSWNASGYLELVGNGTARAIRDQQVTVTTGDRDEEHALRVVIARGPVYIRVGSTSGGDEYVTETRLGTGHHSLSFTPTGDFYIRFFSSQIPSVYVDSCTVEAAGVVSLPAPWATADLGDIRSDQSGDVLYVACDGYQPRLIERRGTRPSARSWSIVLYQPPDGPFLVQNTGPTTITPSALTGNITLTASQPLFKQTHVGGLFSVTSEGQAVTVTASASSTASDSIRVTGIDSARVFSINITGNASSSTVDLQRSFDGSTWSNVSGQQWTANVSTTYDDSLDNQIVLYRLILTTRVAPDDVVMTLRIGSGSIRGVARITAFSSSTSVSAEVLSAMGETTANDVWQEGQWSDKRGWPSSVCFHDGRLWWAGKNGIWGSVSDAFDSFDETLEGDAGPLNRTIGSGPVDKINWLLSLQRLIVGTQGSELSARSSSLDEPLTPSAFSIKACSTQGSGNVQAVNVDQMGYFVNRSGIRVFELSTDIRSTDYQATDMLQLNPELGSPGIVRMAVQRQPDTRLHCVRSDGVVILGVMNKAEEVTAWVTVETDGDIEDVVVLPATTGDVDDQVYYVVKRTINGATVRYLEKWAQEADCRGGSLSYLADSYIEYTGAATTVISGLDHLELEEVVVWADGDDIGTDDAARPWTRRYTVTGGSITLADEYTNVVVGLPYTAQFKSAKLGSLTSAGSPLNTTKQIKHIGLLLADTHARGLKFGQSFDDDDLDDLPRIEDGTAPTGGDYDHDMIPFPGKWTTDARICLEAVAPRHATVIAVTFDLESH